MSTNSQYWASVLAKLKNLNPDAPPNRGRKFYIALACYAALALLAWQTLDGNFRLAVWVFLGYLAVRTYLSTLRKP